MNAKITVKVTLINSHGFTAEDTVEENYPVDLSDDQVQEAVKGFGRGFRNMMEVLRMNNQSGKNGKPSAHGTGTYNNLGAPRTGAGRTK